MTDTAEPQAVAPASSVPLEPSVPGPEAYGDPGEDVNAGIPVPRGRLARFRARFGRREPQPVEDFTQALAELDYQGKQSDLSLRKMYARVLLGGMAIQIGIADWIFIKYMRAYDYKIPTEAMSVWLASTVVEVIGLVVVITRYLFPNDKD